MTPARPRLSPRDSPRQMPTAAGANALRDALERGKALLGMVHLSPLPGAPGALAAPPAEAIERITDSALSDARRLLEGGLDGFVIENFGDTPFYPGRVPPMTVTVMTVIAHRVAAAARAWCAEAGRPPPALAVNVLRNDAAAALSIAAAVGLDAIRVNVHAGAMVTDQGIVTGRAHETLRERARLGAPVLLLADVLVKHARPLGATLPDAADVARETAHRAGADGLIVSGAATGRPVDLARLREVREAVPDVPLLLGSGVTHDTVAALLDSADGVIVGSALKEGGVVSAPVAIERVRALVESARTRHGRR